MYMFKKNEHMHNLSNMTPEHEIFEKAIEALQRETNVAIDKKFFEHVKGNNRPDAELWIQLPEGEKKKFLVEIKRTLTEVTATRLVRDYANNLQNHIFVTNYVHRKMARTLKDLGIQFIDTAGNIFINTPPALIFIHGYPRKDFNYGLIYEEGMFGPAGLKVIFALLCKRDLWNANYREIRTAADVAVGTVANIMRELKGKSFLIEQKNKHKKLIRRKELLDNWVNAYIEKLRPKNIIGKFKSVKPDFWQHTNLSGLPALWGGEISAYMLTRYLKPEITSIYTDKPVNQLIIDLKLRRDAYGDVELFNRFWNFDTVENKQNIVPPLLIYADLIATGNVRNIETAKLIYNEHLEKDLIKD